MPWSAAGAAAGAAAGDERHLAAVVLTNAFYTARYSSVVRSAGLA